MAKTPTLRSLARQLGVSIATVSQALRDSPRSSAATRARVQRAARKAGYRVNPLLGSALSAVRRARHQQFHGTLALIDLKEEPRFALFRQQIGLGAEARARELGFQTSLFELGEVEPALPVSRMPSVFYARGIAGALLMPFNVAQDLAAFDFRRIAAVQMDHSLVRPRLHTILPDHYVSMVNSLERLTARGHRKIGLCLEQHRDARVKCKWSAAYGAFFRNTATTDAIPVLVEPRLSRAGFVEWFKRHRPDLVIGHVQAMVEWMRDLGVRVPTDTGFFNLNVTEQTMPCAGLDLQPQRLGAAAIETIVAMLHRQESGIPTDPQTITLEGKWVEGPTLRGPG